MTQPTVHVGTFTGNGASNQINCGFTPDYVKIQNITDGTMNAEAYRLATNGAAYLTVGSATGATGSFLQQVAPGSGGIAFLDGVTVAPGKTTAGTIKGFRVGATLSTNAKVFAYIAMRSAAGNQGNT